MNKMFNRIEVELKNQAKTKVWLAEKLGESTQNVNHWKKRGVPAAKVASIARVLNINREQLEGEAWNLATRVSEKANEYEVDKMNARRYQVFLSAEKSPLADFLGKSLRDSNGLSFVYVTSWKHSEPFLELNLWVANGSPPVKTFVPLTNIIGIRSL